MKTLSLFACSALLVLLAGCEIIVTGSPPPAPPPAPEPLEVTSFSYQTNYRDQNDRSYICDNRTTQLQYTFRFQGQLVSWRSHLQGPVTNDIEGAATWFPGSDGVSSVASGYEVIYSIPPYMAPLSTSESEDVQPQAIVVVPVPRPFVIGASRLHLTLVGNTERINFVSQDIPVIDNCP